MLRAWMLLITTGAMAQGVAAVHTPAVGSSERKAIYDGMRHRGDITDQVFVVKYLKVAGDWAWTRVEPHSADGKNAYEPESALLHFENSAWKVVDQPCAEDGCDLAQEMERIRKKYPLAPAEIFPE